MEKPSWMHNILQMRQEGSLAVPNGAASGLADARIGLLIITTTDKEGFHAF
jgi:hypothetical protein